METVQPLGIYTSTGETRRRNGLQKPWDSLQMLSWLLYAYFGVSFFFLLVPLLNLATAWPLCAAFLVLFVVVFGLAFYCSYTDSVDDFVYRTGESRVKALEMMYCYYCKRQVHKRSKHCRVCNKCISHFDHHCRWLNCCIGGKTYKQFFALIIAVLCLSALHLALGGILLYNWGSNSAWIGNSGLAGDRVFSSRAGVLACIIVSEIASLGAFGMILNLVVFHIYLIFKNLTTYDFIIAQRENRNRRKTRIAPESDPASHNTGSTGSHHLNSSKWTDEERHRAPTPLEQAYSGVDENELETGTPSRSEFVVEMVTPNHPHLERIRPPMRCERAEESVASWQQQPRPVIQEPTQIVQQLAPLQETRTNSASTPATLQPRPRSSMLPPPAELIPFPVESNISPRDSWDEPA